MTLPRAFVAHAVPGRLRIKIPEKKNDSEWFDGLAEAFRQEFGELRVETNPLTSSVLIREKIPELSEIESFSRGKAFFELLTAEKTARTPLQKHVHSGFKGINERIKTVSGNELDLPVTIFLVLVGAGIIELMRRGPQLPPWYTAFWYALGVFTISLSGIDVFSDTEDPSKT